MRPDFVATDATGFAVTVTPTQVSVTNNNAAPASVNVWLELKHSIPRQLGALPNLIPQPFVSQGGAAGGGGVTGGNGGVGVNGGTNGTAGTAGDVQAISPALGPL